MGRRWICGETMRAIMSYFALIAIVVWMASEGGFDRVDRGHLPIANSKAPTYVSDLPLPDPHELDDLEIVPAAQAADGSALRFVRISGALVNLRSGPGLDYRMIDVAERGVLMHVNGAPSGEWVPIIDPVTGISAWVNMAYVVAVAEE